MRSSWEEVENLFINQWRQKSTPLHMIFVGKTVPLSINAAVMVGESVPAPVLEAKFLILRGSGLECFVASDCVTEIKYSEPGHTSVGRERYACFIEFVSADGSSLILGELVSDE